MLSCRAFTLIELLISLLLGSMVVLAITTALVNVSQQILWLQQVSRLNNELSVVSSLIEQQMLNMGYDAHAIIRKQSVPRQLSPFAKSLVISAYPGEQTDSCILFSYDKNHDGKLSLKSPNERFGFRLNNKAIEFRIKGADCAKKKWQDLTDSKNISIDNVKFLLQQSNFGSQPTQGIKLTIQASLKSNSQISMTSMRFIPLRNTHV